MPKKYQYSSPETHSHRLKQRFRTELSVTGVRSEHMECALGNNYSAFWRLPVPASKAFCKRRNELAEHLIELSIQLSIAAVEMADVAGASRNAAFVKAKLEAERLRD